MTDKDKNANLSHLAWALGGVIAGSWFVRNRLAESRKSRAERDYPDDAERVYDEMISILNEWEPDEEAETEDDFTQDLAEYLEENTDFEIQIYPSTEVGKPDILIDDVLALELKVSPKKTEQDRCIGQCADYSRLWITWVVLIDTEASDIGRLKRVLQDKNLEHIEVWDFS